MNDFVISLPQDPVAERLQLACEESAIQRERLMLNVATTRQLLLQLGDEVRMRPYFQISGAPSKAGA